MGALSKRSLALAAAILVAGGAAALFVHINVPQSHAATSYSVGADTVPLAYQQSALAQESVQCDPGSFTTVYQAAVTTWASWESAEPRNSSGMSAGDYAPTAPVYAVFANGSCAEGAATFTGMRVILDENGTVVSGELWGGPPTQLTGSAPFGGSWDAG